MWINRQPLIMDPPAAGGSTIPVIVYHRRQFERGMAGILKQSTAVDVLIGPFVDSTDGDTEETALTINQSDVRLSKNGQTGAQKNDVTAAAHDADGFYNCELDATDTNTIGQLTLYVHVAGALAVRHDYQVVEEVIYDALFATSAAAFDANQRVDVGSWLGTAVTTSSTTSKPEVDVNSISDDATAANNCELMFDGTGYAGGTTKLDVNTTQIEGADATDTIADAVWDETLTTSNHNSAQSAGKQLRQLDQAFVVTEGTAQAGAATTITLAAGESSTDDIFRGDRVQITAGTGVGEHGIVTAYNGTTKVATMAENWVITPDATSEYILSPADCDVETWQHIVVTNDATSSKPDVNIFSISGDTTAADNLESYTDGTTPAPVNVTQISGDATAADNLESYTDGTTPQPVNVTQISGDATAADNAELMFDGTGYAGGTTKLGVDIISISGDTTAADNAELMFDGTGYAGGTEKLQVDAVEINSDTTAAAQLAKSAAQIISGTVDDTALSPTTTVFEADDITEATADHYNGRIIIFTSGALAGQASDITDYELSGANGKFTVTALTEAPANNVTFVIV